MSSHVASLALSMSVVLMAAGCSDGGQTSPQVATYTGQPPGLTALAVGDAVVVDGCVHLEAKDGRLLLPVFPAEPDRDWADEIGLDGKDDRVAVRLGGGEGQLSSLNADVPIGCDESAPVWIVGDLTLP